MKIYLVRHGEAKTEEEDPERPLTEQGAGQVKRVAQFLAGAVEATRLIHSGKTRARQTAEILQAEAAPTVAVEEGNGLGPNDDPGTWAGRLAQIEAPVALVGHLPFMGRLASQIIGAAGEAVAFETAGVACLERDDEGRWQIVWLVGPAVVR